MKKNILAIAIILNCSFIMAQTEFDALKVIQSDINGTARYMSMAGAFGALGGDASAIKDNPAGLGIYRSSEMTGTLNLMVQNSNSIWNATNGYDNLNKIGFNNFSYVKATPTYRSEESNTGLLSSNWSFSFNRLKSFDRNSTIKSQYANSSITDYMSYITNNAGNINSADLSSDNSPYDNINVPWISVVGYQGYLINENVNPVTNQSTWPSLLGTNEQVKPSFSIQESGFLDEYSIGWAGNFSNFIYLGATVNLQSLDYNENSQYSEIFSGNGGMTLSNTITTSGVGFNMNVGAIIRPIDMLRFGVSVHSPTVFAVTDNNYANLDYYLTRFFTTNGNFDTPSATNSYMLSTPWKFNGSAAVIIGQKGLISAEYDYSLNTGTSFMDQNGNYQNYAEENAGMKSMLKDVQTIKIGAEYKLTNNISLRAGYATMSAGSNPLADKLIRFNTTRTDTEYFLNNKTDYITGGIGYREGNWYIDLAYMNKMIDETFYPYNTNELVRLNPNLSAVNPASVKTMNNNIVITVGFKF